MASLLIGNGINYLGEGAIGWSDLLDSLIGKIDKLEIINTNEKPFLHLYEEIFTRAEKYRNIDEEKIKEAIVNEIRTMKPNDYHQKIIELPFENILTLNYDYNFTNNSDVKNREPKYSLKRYQIINDKKVWHIHGELDKQTSIMLGYSHYMDSIHNIQSYLNSSKRNEKNNSTWVDIFLTNDIYILGAGLDFEELDIWWLLSYRNRELLERKIDNSSSIGNKKIIYIDIVDEATNHDEIQKKRNEAKLSMLETFGVEIETFTLKDIERKYQLAYDNVIAYFHEQLN